MLDKIIKILKPSILKPHKITIIGDNHELRISNNFTQKDAYLQILCEDKVKNLNLYEDYISDCGFGLEYKGCIDEFLIYKIINISRIKEDLIINLKCPIGKYGTVYTYDKDLKKSVKVRYNDNKKCLYKTKPFDKDKQDWVIKEVYIYNILDIPYRGNHYLDDNINACRLINYKIDGVFIPRLFKGSLNRYDWEHYLNELSYRNNIPYHEHIGYFNSYDYNMEVLFRNGF